MFVTDGCHVCAAEKEAARALAASDKGVNVLMVNVDDVLSLDPALASRMFDSFDLSTLPFIIQTDRKGVVARRYISFLE
jgi:thiol-disulfide isomerase/thioredoxin